MFSEKMLGKIKEIVIADESILFIDPFIILCFLFSPSSYGDACNVGCSIPKQANLPCPVNTHL